MSTKKKDKVTLQMAMDLIAAHSKSLYTFMCILSANRGGMDMSFELVSNICFTIVTNSHTRASNSLSLCSDVDEPSMRFRIAVWIIGHVEYHLGFQINLHTID